MSNEVPTTLARLDIRAIRRGRLEGCRTEIWRDFFESHQYLDWKAGESQEKLRIYAAPLCGKTTFAAAVAEAVDADGIVVSIFLDPKDEDDCLSLDLTKTDDPARALSKAILTQLPERSDAAEPAVSSLEEARVYSNAQAGQTDTVFLILDGYDSCSPSMRHILDEEMSNLIRQGYRLLITSAERNVPTTCDACARTSLPSYWHCKHCLFEYDLCHECFKKGVRCTHAGHVMYESFKGIDLDLSVDMNLYLNDEIDIRLQHGEYDRRLDEQLKLDSCHVKKVITDKALLNFAVCKVLVDHLRDEQMAGYDEITHLHDRISFPQAEFFGDVFRRVKLQAKDQTTIAMTALYVVSEASKLGRYIYLNELADLIFSAIDTSFIGGPKPSTLIGLCQGLIMINADSTVSFFHLVFPFFLVENCEDDLHEVQLDMAELCLKCLKSVPTFSAWDIENEQSLQTFLERRRFAAYAARTWGAHLAMSSCYRSLRNHPAIHPDSNTASALQILEDGQRLASILYLACSTSSDFTLWPGCHPIHVCVRFDLTMLSPHLENWTGINFNDTIYGRTPFVDAAVAGNLSFVMDAQQILPAAAISSNDISNALLEILEAAFINHERSDLLLSHLEAISKTKPTANPLVLGASRSTHSAQDQDDGRPHAEPLFVNSSPLTYAMDKYESYELCERLINFETVDINAALPDGTTALHHAVRRRYFQIIRLLLDHPASTLRQADKTGSTALHHAALSGTPEIISFVLLHKKCNADTLNLRNVHHSSAIMLLFENFCLDQDTEDLRDMLELFRNAGSDLHYLDKNSRGLVHMAAKEQKFYVLEYLFQQGLPIDACDSRQWSPLHVACSVGSSETAAKLLQLGASLYKKDVNGKSPAEVASLYGHPGLLDRITKPETQQQYTSAAGQSQVPIWSLAITSPEDLLDACIKAGAVFDETDPLHGNTALQSAMPIMEDGDPQEWDEKLLMYLIDRSNVNITNDQGKTALDHVILSGSQDDPCYLNVVRALLSKGADPDRILPTGQNLIDAARVREKWKAALLLIQHSKSTIRLDSDFGHLLKEAFRNKNVIAVEKLMVPEIRVLRLYCDQLPSALARHAKAGDQILQLLKRKEHAALRKIWPVVKP